jgi:hypothetical protein
MVHALEQACLEAPQLCALALGEPALEIHLVRQRGLTVIDRSGGGSNGQDSGVVVMLANDRVEVVQRQR